MLNFVLCDDNSNILDKLCKMLESIFINNKIDATIALKTTDSNNVLSYIEKNPVDVFLFDIELNADMSGLDLAQKVREQNRTAYIIFSTAHLEYVLMAYKVKTFDYLPKPITLDRLKETVLRLISDTMHNPKKYIRLENRHTVINQDSVYYIQKDGMKVVFHTDSRPYELYSSFNKIESCLPENFVRCHKSYIVNVDKVIDIKHSNTILFDNSDSCFIGPKYKNNFLEVFKNANFTNDDYCCYDAKSVFN